MKKLQINNSEDIKKNIDEILKKRHKTASTFIRLYSIKLFISGKRIKEIADIFSINVTTIRRWIYTINDLGIKGLFGKNEQVIQGARSKLKPEIAKRILSDLKNSRINWNCGSSKINIFRDYLIINYKIKYSERHCRNILKKLDIILS